MAVKARNQSPTFGLRNQRQKEKYVLDFSVFFAFFSPWKIKLVEKILKKKKRRISVLKFILS